MRESTRQKRAARREKQREIRERYKAAQISEAQPPSSPRPYSQWATVARRSSRVTLRQAAAMMGRIPSCGY